MSENYIDAVSERPFAVIFGATSLVGRYLLKRLVDGGFGGLCLTRRSGQAPYDVPEEFSWCNVTDEDLEIPVSAILFSLAPLSVLPSLLAHVSGGRALVALSSSSAVYKAASSDPTERKLANELARSEEEIQKLCHEMEMTCTIFRPTLIYDPGRDKNVSMIAEFVRRFGVFPVVWPGTGHRQPIHADDVALAMVAAAVALHSSSVRFDLPGGEELTYREMVRRIFNSLGRRPLLLYLPLGLARPAFFVWRAVTGRGYSVASLERMNLDLTLDPGPVKDALGVTGRSFHPKFLHQPDA